jgi:hypothetical protein
MNTDNSLLESFENGSLPLNVLSIESRRSKVTILLDEPNIREKVIIKKIERAIPDNKIVGLNIRNSEHDSSNEKMTKVTFFRHGN